MSIYVFGHQHPDTDSITSAVALAYLKKQQGMDAIPCRLDTIGRETQFVLDYFNLQTPQLIDNVKVQVKDIRYDFTQGITPECSILTAYQTMVQNHFETLAVLDNEENLLGIVSMKDIAMGLIKGDFYHLKTSLRNLAATLGGTLLTEQRKQIDGKISVIAFYYKTIRGTLGPDSIIIVGDRYDIIEHAIESGVQLIILTGANTLPRELLSKANSNGISILSVPQNTFHAAKIIDQCNYVSTIMRSGNIIKFIDTQYLEELKDELANSHFRNYPVVDLNNRFLGFINRKHLMNPERKQVILVDHNESGQSADGLEEAQILEVVDHHKIGDLSTSMPISFRNKPVGSTCTIVAEMYQEAGVEIPDNIAGALISGIISDTLYFKSPTTTDQDQKTVEKLNGQLNLNLEEYAMEMFRAGTSLEGQSTEDVFYKDFKSFYLEGEKVGISQVFTLDLDEISNRKNQLQDLMKTIKHEGSYYLVLLLVTDILKEGSYVYYVSRTRHLLTTAFSTTVEQGTFIPHVISRKKQVIPKIVEAILSSQ
ncbi:MAG: putative manganese-dependent inorganic diphosphatase [Tindallia sp. MSAO_Bac2]|nr:MAG: putative manganese-dependent inorganic diphosphatase [Tindallia sp. MSAO_Bac2]